MPRFDHILLVGFGAPENIEDVDAFLRIVSQGRNIPESRLAAVRHHYELIGGGSPYNHCAFALAAELEKKLAESGMKLPVFCGMRNWHPFLKDKIVEIRDRGLRHGLAVILSPYRSPAGCARYKKALAEAVEEAGAGIAYEYLENWIADVRFLSILTAGIAEAMRKESRNPHDVAVLFSAHSIPESMNGSCGGCNYRTEHETTSRAAAAQLHLASWTLCYQSRSGNPREKWLEPDILSVISGKAAEWKNLLVVPAGFMLDNAEILYDIDIEARQLAEQKGIHLSRSATVGNDPRFCGFLADKVREFVLDSSNVR